MTYKLKINKTAGNIQKFDCVQYRNVQYSVCFSMMTLLTGLLEKIGLGDAAGLY
jgi:hypothetical protein